MVLREWVGNKYWVNNTDLFNHQMRSKKTFSLKHVFYFHTSVPAFSILEWPRPHSTHSGFSHALSMASLGREWMLSSSLLQGWEMKPRVAEWLDKLWRGEHSVGAAFPGQCLPPWMPQWVVSLVSRCTSLPPPPHLHHSFGKNYSFDWKFSMLDLYSKGEER